MELWAKNLKKQFAQKQTLEKSERHFFLTKRLYLLSNHSALTTYTDVRSRKGYKNVNFLDPAHDDPNPVQEKNHEPHANEFGQTKEQL